MTKKKQPLTFFSQLDDEKVGEALARFALTADGMIVYRGLEKALYAVTESTDSGALLIENGGRRFARRLADIMAKSIAESGSVGSSELGRPVVYVTGGKPAGGNDSRASGRRGPPIAPGDGFYDPTFHGGPAGRRSRT